MLLQIASQYVILAMQIALQYVILQIALMGKCASNKRHSGIPAVGNRMLCCDMTYGHAGMYVNVCCAYTIGSCDD